MKNVYINDISYYLPNRVVTNQEIIDANQLKIKDSWISKRIGIDTRHWCDENQAASDLAVEAVKKLGLKNFKGSIWVSTISQDYFTPSTASIVKGKLDLVDDCPAFDLNAACAGQIFALENAKQRLLSTPEEDEALVIATETRSKFLNKKDRRTVFLFGDGACAIHLKKGETTKSNIEWTHLKTIASKDFEILVPGGGSVYPLGEQNEIKPYIKMQDGDKIFQMTTESLTEIIRVQLSKSGQSIDDYNFLVFHQGNGAIIKKVCENLGVPEDKTLINFHKFGNTSSASMGIALAEANELGKINSGDRILMMAMGAGHHIGLASVVWGNQ